MEENVNNKLKATYYTSFKLPSNTDTTHVFS